MTDQELLKAILSRYKWTHQQLADYFAIHRVSVTNLVNGKTHLRPAMRKKLEQMMDGLLLIEAEEQPK